MRANFVWACFPAAMRGETRLVMDKIFLVRSVLVFWAWCLISASLSALPSYSLSQASVWIRFPLFAFASAFWLARDPRIIMAMLLSMGAGMLIMSGILFAEFVIIGQRMGVFPGLMVI